MKTLKLFSLLFFASLLAFSCQKEEEMIPELETVIDLAAEVEGTYLGSISDSAFIYLDYTVTVTRIDNNHVRCQGEDAKLPPVEFEIKEADPFVGKDWITQPNTFQLDSIFTFVRENQHLTIIREDLDASFGGYKQ